MHVELQLQRRPRRVHGTKDRDRSSLEEGIVICRQGGALSAEVAVHDVEQRPRASRSSASSEMEMGCRTSRTSRRSSCIAATRVARSVVVGKASI